MSGPRGQVPAQPLKNHDCVRNITAHKSSNSHPCCRATETRDDEEATMEAAELSLHGMGAVDAPLTADTRTRDALLSNAHPEQEGNGCPTGRRRAQSVASVSTVETVIVKAKRAASSLWMLLHSQNCAMATCSHGGCQEAKLLHLHIKTCAAGTGFECPSNYPGCDTARKLLAHYHRCRMSRVRQAGQLSTRRDAGQQQCLLCSLVARQARNMLDDGAVRLSSSGSSSSAKTPSKKPATSASITLDIPTKVIGEPLAATNDNKFMPPPPPRRMDAVADELKCDRDSLHRTSSTPHDVLRTHLLNVSACSASSRIPSDGFRDSNLTEENQLRRANYNRGRDRSLSVSKDASSHQNSSYPIATMAGSHRRRSASLGSPPHGGTPLSDTIVEEEDLIEGPEYPN